MVVGTPGRIKDMLNRQYLVISCLKILIIDEADELLGQGFLELSDRNLAKLAAAVMSFKFTSIDQIMILDKPDVTWDDVTAERLYLKLSTMFELQGRYHAITQRAETLLDVTGVLSNLSHARRSARLEWIIIILIALEILLALLYKLA